MTRKIQLEDKQDAIATNVSNALSQMDRLFGMTQNIACKGTDTAAHIVTLLLIVTLLPLLTQDTTTDSDIVTATAIVSLTTLLLYAQATLRVKHEKSCNRCVMPQTEDQLVMM